MSILHNSITCPFEGPFITISNHHFGGADGLMLSAIVGAIRPDLKLSPTFSSQ